MAFWLPFGFNRADGVTPLPSQPAGSGANPQVIGTSDPAGALASFGNQSGFDTNGQPIYVEQQPGSPTIERAEQCTGEQTVKTTWQGALDFLSVCGRGTFVKDSFGNVFRILSSVATWIGGGLGEFKTVTESISFDTPPDDYQMTTTELGLDILKHPRYFWCLNPNPTDTTTYAKVGDAYISLTDVKESIVRMIQAYRDAPFYPSAGQINGLIQNNILVQIKGNQTTQTTTINTQVPNPKFNFQNTTGSAITDPVNWDGTNAQLATATIPSTCQYLIVSVPVNLSNPNDPAAIALAAAREVIYKLWRQEDTPYLVGFEITWTQYFFEPVYENPGGYIEDPVTVVPDYFISPVQNSVIARSSPGQNSNNDTSPPPASGAPTIFDQMAQINPQCYGLNGKTTDNVAISWLRKADEVIYQRTWFAVTHKWVGSPIGHWDVNLYTQNNGPQNANDFNTNP